MTCLEAQSHITAFINDQLDMNTLEDFLAHVNQCAECREELEVYYALLTAMKLLDEDKELSDNFKEELEHKLKVSGDRIRKKKIARVRHRFYILLVALGFVIITSTTVTQKFILPVKPPKPSFRLRYTGVPERISPIMGMRIQYDEEAKNYTRRRRETRIIVYDRIKEDKLLRKLPYNSSK